MEWRIGKTSEKTVDAQSVAPLLCRVLSAMDETIVPFRYQRLKRSLLDVGVTKAVYVKEIVSLVRSFPNRISVESETIHDLKSKLQDDSDEIKDDFAVKAYVLAYMYNSTDAYKMWRNHSVGTIGPVETKRLTVYTGLLLGIRQNRTASAVPMETILTALLKCELVDRQAIVAKLVDAPFYFPYGNEFVMLSLAHYHPPFVSDYRNAVGQFVKSEESIDRVEWLVRRDFDLFCSTLMKIPGRFPYCKRFETAVWNEEGHPESGRIMFAFASIWAHKCLERFANQWNLTPSNEKTLWKMAKEGWTPTLYETTWPFGSRIDPS